MFVSKPLVSNRSHESIIMEEKRIMALDVGTKRIGVALSDPLMITAQPFKTIETKSALSELTAISKEYKVYKIIVGIPLELSGSVGEQAKQVLEFVEKLSNIPDIEVETIDERLSSKQAERVLQDKKLKGKDRHAAVDKMAATILLEHYMSSQSGQF